MIIQVFGRHTVNSISGIDILQAVLFDGTIDSMHEIQELLIQRFWDRSCVIPSEIDGTPCLALGTFNTGKVMRLFEWVVMFAGDFYIYTHKQMQYYFEDDDDLIDSTYEYAQHDITRYNRLINAIGEPA